MIALNCCLRLTIGLDWWRFNTDRVFSKNRNRLDLVLRNYSYSQISRCHVSIFRMVKQQNNLTLWWSTNVAKIYIYKIEYTSICICYFLKYLARNYITLYCHLFSYITYSKIFFKGLFQATEPAKPPQPQQSSVLSELFSEQESFNSLRSQRNIPHKDKGILWWSINEDTDHFNILTV